MPSEEKNYEQSALGKRVNELMDDGYDFGEAVKQAMSEGLKDGGSVGIEILFGPKVPAAPSQLVSESDILLGYRGDAAYRSRSEQSKSIGQGNVGSKASFGGGQGTDSSGQSEGAGGVNPNQYTSNQQNVNQIKAQLGIKDPNLLQKTFNKYNSLPFGVKGAINTMAPVELMKLFQVGNVLNTGYNQIKRPVLTDEDILLEPGALPDLALGATEEISFEGNSPFMRNQINERIIAAENKYYEQGKMPPEFLGDKIRMNMELGNYDGYMGPGFEDGGRVGLFMGGPALEGEALSIYNSMKAYGNDDQTIADRLQALGMYTPPDPTPDAPDAPDAPDQGIINQQLNQGGGDGPQGDFGKFGNLLKDTEKTFTKDVYAIDKNMYPGAEMTGSFKPTEITGYQDVTSGLYKTEDGKNINHLGLNIKPGIISLLEKLGFGDLDETQFTGLPYEEGYIAGTFTGKNPFDFFKKQQATNAEIAAANLKAKQELEAKLAAEAAAAALQQQMQDTGVTGSNYNQAANIAGGGGGDTATYGGQTAREATYDNDKSTGTSQGYSQHYARGGLAMMFTRRR